MDTVTPIPLTHRLANLATIWAARNDAPVSRIGRAVLNDPNFFKELGVRVKGPSTTTVEQLAAWFADPANWAGGNIPQEARDLAHVTGVTAPGLAASAGIAGESSPGDRPSAERTAA